MLETHASPIDCSLALSPALLESIRETAHENDTNGLVHADIWSRLASAELHRAWWPTELGGYMADLETVVQLVEDLATVDGSISWMYGIEISSSLIVGYMPRDGAEELANSSSSGLPRLFSSFDSSGHATAVPGGYRVSGQWRPCTACEYADWYSVVASVHDAPNPDHPFRLFVVPAQQVTIERTWDTSGLRASGGHTVRLDDAFVPVERSAASDRSDWWPATPHYSAPFRTVSAPVLAAVALGLARRAVHEAAHIAVNRRDPNGRRRSDSEIVRRDLAERHVRLTAASDHFRQTIRTAWSGMTAGWIDDDTQARLRLASSHVVDQSCEAVRAAFQWSGTRAVSTGSSINRASRDVETLARHSAFAPDVYPNAGGILLTAYLDDPVVRVRRIGDAVT